MAKPPTTKKKPAAAKPKDEVFMFMGRPDGKGEGQLSFSLKLPTSNAAALQDDNAAPSGYGLGAKGCVNWVFRPGDAVDRDRFVAFVDESYRAIAPKTLVKELGQRP